MDNISLNRNIFHFAGAHFLFLLGIDNLAVAGNGESYVFKDSANAEIELNVLIGIVGNYLTPFSPFVFTNSSQFFSPRIYFAAPAPASWLSSVT